jgi:hypothetical protein
VAARPVAGLRPPRGRLQHALDVLRHHDR